MKYVYWNMPHMLRRKCHILIGNGDMNGPYSGKYIFTLNTFIVMVVSNVRSQTSRQERGTAPSTWRSKHKIRASPRRTFQHYFVFRFQGSCAGPVRDASQASYRQTAGKGYRRNIRSQSSHILSNSQNIQSERNPGSYPSETWPERTKSMYARDSTVCPATLGRISRSHYGICPSGSFLTFWPDNSSSDIRTRPQKSWKGGATNPQSVGMGCRSEIISQYESLRKSALHFNTIQYPAMGLGVFVLRGMIGWIEALPSLISHHRENSVITNHNARLGANGRSEFISILANMIVSSTGGF